MKRLELSTKTRIQQPSLLTSSPLEEHWMLTITPSLPVGQSLDAAQQRSLVADVRQAVKFAASDLKGEELMPGFCLPKGGTSAVCSTISCVKVRFI